ALTPSGLTSANYAITFGNGTLTISSAALAITVNDQSKVYGAVLPALTVSYSGFVNGDTAASLTTPPAVTMTATASSPAGSYPITASGAAAANYSISYVPGTLTVSPAPLTITANNQTKMDGAPLPELTVNYSGFVNGDTASSLTTAPTVTTTATANSPVGSYAINVSGAVAANYSISYVPGTLTINSGSFTVLLRDSFGGLNTTQRLDAAGSPLLVDSHRPELAGIRAETPNSSTEVWTAPGGQKVKTWAFSFTSSDPFEAPSALGTPGLNGSATFQDVANTGADALLPFSPPATAYQVSLDPVAGSAGIAIGFSSSQSVLTNNFASFGEVWLSLGGGSQGASVPWTLHTVGTAGPSVSGFTTLQGFNPLIVAYDPVNHTVQGTVNGVPTPSISYTAASINAVGFEGSGTVDNFVVQSAPPIALATLTVTANNQSRTYGAANPSLTGTITGLQPGDNITATFSTVADSNSPVGDYAITVTLSDPDNKLSNYSVTSNAGTLSITRVPLSVTAVNASKTFGAAAPAFTVSYAGFVDGETAAVLGGTLAIARARGESVGTYALTPSGLTSANYAINFVPGTLTITEIVPAPVMRPLAGAGTTNVVISWSAISNVTYRVEYSPDLSGTNWVDLEGDVTANGDTASKTDTHNAPSGFYRVRVL
ncbi:MAG: MBG domain-containing protein, partial [Verrucomicrobia bacterium]|nr:MBG domain-containing protein [Verrucomicrobiota bacterium]